MATPFSNIESVFFGVTATGDNTLDPLLGPQKWGTSVGSSAVLGFSFPGSLSVYEAGYGDGSAEEWDNYTELSFQQKGAFRDALQEFNNVANVSFSEFADNATTAGEIRIAMTESLSGTNTIAYAYYPFTDGTGGDIWLNPDDYDNDGPAVITPGAPDGLYSTLLHEIGHALGLSHPFEVEIGSTPLSSPLDNMFYTIMSYTLDPTGMDYFPDREPTTLMLLDIQALQHLYGANTSYNSGNNTYSYSDTGEYLETIWDGGGIDEINYAGASVSAIIDLREGEWSSLGQPIFFDDGLEGGYSDERTVWIAYGAEIENAFGGEADDLIFGNDLDNVLDGDLGDDEIIAFDGEDTLVGWTGDDTLDGGDGLDTAFYYGNRADYTVTKDNEDDTWTVVDDVVGASNEGTDTLTDIEYLEFADETALLINLPPSGGVFISGIAREDETLTASNSLNDPNGNGSVSYTWYVGGVEVPDYSGSSLLLIPADIGKTVTVTASYIDGDGYFESVSSGPTAPVENLNDEPTGQPVIIIGAGGLLQGETLVASQGDLADGDGLGPISYVWKAAGSIVGSGSSYQPSQADVGKSLTLTASYTDLSGTSESVESSSTTSLVLNVNDEPVGLVSVAGSIEQGKVLTASNTLSDLDGLGSITYTWKADGEVITGGTTYRLTQNEVGKAITVTASYTDQQGTEEVVDSEPTAPVANVNDAPQGTVTISGIPVQGQELTASNDLVDADGLGAISYTWKANGITVGNGETFTPGQDEVGKAITVTASYTDLQGTNEFVDSDPTSDIANVNDAPVGSVTISGTAEQGQQLSASNNLTDLDGLGTISYTWRANGDAVGTASTFTPGQDEVGKTITVTASYTDQQGTDESVESNATIAVANVNDDPDGTVTISGTAEQGQQLSASNNLSDLDGLGTINYIWRANGDTVGTASTFTPGQAEVGKTITATAAYTDQQGTPESVESDATAAVANVNDDPVGMVTISGAAEQGQTLSASNNITDVDGTGTVTYSWAADGEEVGTGPTFTPGQAEVGKTITATAAYTDQQGTEESVDSDATDPVANVNDDPVGMVTISGTAEQGQELSASNNITDVDGTGTITYTWTADGEEVGTGPTFTPGQAEVGKTITATAAYTDQQGTEESVDSDATDPVANVNDDPVGMVTISGTAEQGQELSASNNITDVDGAGTVTYTWAADGEEVGTGPTFTPGQDEVGKTITATAAYTDQQGTEESVTSDPTAAVANVNDDPVGDVTISGTPEQYQELTASNTLTDLDGLGTISYTWKADGDTVGSGPTFIPDQVQVDETITVTASYTDLFGNPESVESEPTAPVANVNDDPFGTFTITGTAEQGQLLTASPDFDDLDGLGPLSFSWTANGVIIADAIGPSFTPGQDEVGKTIRVTATYTDREGTEETVSSDPTAAVTNVNDDPEGAVTISGAAVQDRELTAENTLSDPDGLGTISYSWKADGEEVGTGTTFTPGQDEVGKTITVTASYTDLQGTEESVDSDPTAPVQNENESPVGAVTISGIAAQGQALTASNDLSDGDGLGEISYSWRADGEALDSNGPTFTPGQDEVGKTIRVTASYTDQQGADESVDSEPTEPVANVNDVPSGTVTISGTPEQGVELTASDTLEDPDGLGTISYTWMADGEEVDADVIPPQSDGAVTGMTFTPRQSEVGKTITVTASYTDAYGTEESMTSEATAPVANVNDDPTGAVSIAGTAIQGGTLTATNTLADADGLGDVTYRWNSGGTDRGTGMTLLLTQADVGNTVTVSAAYTDLGGFLETVSSLATAPVENVNDPPAGLVLVTGTALVGETLSVSNTLSDADGLGSISYTWKADDTTVGVGDSYLLTEAEVGKSLTATAMYTDGGGFAEAVTSDATATVEPIEADPLFNTESFIDVADFIVTASLVRDVIGVLPGTDAGEGVIQSFNIQNGATTENGQAKAGKFGEFQLDPDTGEYRYVPILEAVFSAGNDDSEVFIISASDGGVTEYRIINVANFDNNEFIIADSNNDGLLYDAELMLQSGEVVTAADAQLYRTYAGALGRTPDVGGFDWWAGEIAAGRKVLADLGADFIWSPEFLSFFEGATRPDEISSEDFILHMYNFVFGREPDPGGFVFWTGVLDTGSKSQGQVVLEMTQSNEFVGITALAAVDFLVG